MNAYINELPRHPTLTEDLMERLKLYIQSEGLQPGDKMPTQADIVSTFNVSRTVVREAVKGLETMGIVESKQGEGVYIKAFDVKPLAGRIAFELERTPLPERIKYLYEARERFEVGAVDLIIRRINKCDHQRIQEILQQMQAVSAEDAGALKLDSDFHSALMEASHNPIVSHFGNMLQELFNIIAENPRLYSQRQYSQIYLNHKTLYEAIRTGDVQQAEQTMLEHIRSSLRNRAQKIDQDKSAV